MSAPCPQADVEARVREAAACCLRVAAADIDPDAPLTRYGLDSLNAVELAAALAESTGRDVCTEALLDYSSLSALTAYLLKPGEAPPAGPPLERMRADCVLPGDIDPSRVQAVLQGTTVLTGATGFLGVHLLAALLRE